MQVDVTQLILIMISFQSLLFAVILFSDNGVKKGSNRLLAAFLGLLGTQMALITAIPWLPESNFIDNSGCIFGFNYGPLLWLYTRSLIYRDFRLEWKDTIHFIPTLILLLGLWMGYPMCSRLGWAIYLFLIGYVTASVALIYKYRKIVQQTQSTAASINLKWLQWTIIIFSLVLFSDILDQYLMSMDILPGVSAVHLSLLFLVNGMFFKGIKQPQIFLGIRQKDQEFLVEKKGNKPMEIVADLSGDAGSVLQFLDREKPFRYPDLSLKDLADALQMNPRELSQIINQEIGVNFMGLINEKRIDLAKFYLKNPRDPKVTILETMYEVGFKSKSSFNTLFKKYTGMTPSEYKRQ